jgi:hypothetical protein
MELSSAWMIGFEIEVVLGSLGIPEFCRDEPMDEASSQYCRAVAKNLRQITGLPWSAPEKPKQKPGYYVLPEYNLDPLHWPGDCIGGVELVTPPVPLRDAEGLRRNIAEAILDLDGWLNLEFTPLTSEFGWHINVDAGGDQRLDRGKFMLGADELSVLLANDRYPSTYAAPQRHAYGVALLRHIMADRSGELLEPYLGNLLFSRCGIGKRFGANFGKLDRGYIELRHFSTPMFMSKVSLHTLLEPLLRSFQMDHKSERKFSLHTIRVFQTLASWLDQLRPRFSHEWERPSEFTCARHGIIMIDHEPVARTVFDGSFDIFLRGNDNRPSPAAIYGVGHPDMFEGLALLALDAAEIGINSKKQSLPVHSALFRKEIGFLKRRLRSQGLATRPQAMPSEYWPL